MTDPHWERIKELLHRAMQLAPAQRQPFIDEACGGDPGLRVEVQSLLAASERVPQEFLESPPPADGAASAANDEIGAMPDRRRR